MGDAASPSPTALLRPSFCESGGTEVKEGFDDGFCVRGDDSAGTYTVSCSTGVSEYSSSLHSPTGTAAWHAHDSTPAARTTVNEMLVSIEVGARRVVVAIDGAATAANAYVTQLLATQAAATSARRAGGGSPVPAEVTALAAARELVAYLERMQHVTRASAASAAQWAQL